jgi:hypothetical protein
MGQNMNVIKTKKFGKELAVQEELVGKQDHCLCWQGCKWFKPNEKDNCPIAQDLFEFNKKYGITTLVWECETFEKLE